MSLQTDVDAILARDPQNKYVQKLQAMVDNEEIDFGVTDNTVHVTHPAGCSMIKTGICDCDPTVTIGPSRQI